MLAEPFSLTALLRRFRDWGMGWWSWPNSLKMWSFLLGVGLLLIVGAWIWLWGSTRTAITPATSQPVSLLPSSDSSSLSQEKLESIFIDVSGAVSVPGVYQLESGQLVAEAIAKAGGLSTLSDYRYVHKQINLAAAVSPGSKIYVPFMSEVEVLSESNQMEKQNEDSTSEISRISLNTGSLEELDSLPGIGEKRASEIVQNRPYQSVEELLSKEILTETLYSELKDSISL